MDATQFRDMVRNEDWIKTLAWDLPTRIDELVTYLGPHMVEKLPNLPAWEAAPEGLKKKIVAYNGFVSAARQKASGK